MKIAICILLNFIFYCDRLFWVGFEFLFTNANKSKNEKKHFQLFEYNTYIRYKYFESHWYDLDYSFSKAYARTCTCPIYYEVSYTVLFYYSKSLKFIKIFVNFIIDIIVEIEITSENAFQYKQR